MTAYYNEIDPFVAQWLRNLIADNNLPPGDVDERSIEDVAPDDIMGYDQCHFFAGIGGWPLALRQAGWPDDKPVWTGSCPCQPFSTAGKGSGFADERHLWPAFHWLIQERLPTVVFGEQVASSRVDPWIDLVHADLEALDYAFGCLAAPAASVGAPHIRERAYWVAYSERTRLEGFSWYGDDRGKPGRVETQPTGPTAESCELGGLGNAHGERCNGIELCIQQRQSRQDRAQTAGASETGGFWQSADWLPCADGKWRPVEPGTFPLAARIPGRVGQIRAYGNAICVPQAVEFIKMIMES